MYKRLYFIGIGAYMVMLVLSVLFYKERIIILDTSFFLFHIIKEGFFHIEFYRFGEVFTQILPLLAVKAGLSLNAVVMSYSLGFMIYYFACYFICGSLLKQYDLALIILLLNVLFVSDTFYWIPSELPQGIALLMLILAFVRDKEPAKMKPLGWGALFLSVATLAFFHPLLVIVLVYAVVFFMVRGDLFTGKKLLYGIAIVFFLGVLIKATAFRTVYERQAMSGLKNFIRLFPDYFTLYSNKRFLSNCISRYYWIGPVFAGIVILYFTGRKWKELAFFLCSFFGYLLLINVSSPTDAAAGFYMECSYLPLSVFLGLPFVFELLPVLEKKKMAIPIMLLILLTGCVRIYASHNVFTDRLNYERRLLDKYVDKKVIIKAQQADRDTLQMIWGTPYELLLLSASERHKPASIIVDENPEQRGWAKDVKNGLLVNWDTFPYKEIPVKYFNFTDTVTGYAVIAQ